MSEIVGSLGIELKLERANYDRQLKALQTEKGGIVQFAAALDTRALRRQIDNLSRSTSTINLNARIANLNALEGQLKTLTRERTISIGVRLDDRSINQQLRSLTQSRIVRLQAAVINAPAIERQLSNLTRDRSVRIGFEIDDRGVGQKLSKYADRSFKVTAQVDDRQLTALNKHLDLKQKHFTQVNNYFSSRKLTPKTDLSYLDDLSKRLDQFKNASIDIGINFANARSQVADLKAQLGSIEIPVTVRNASRQTTQQVSTDTSGLERNVTQALDRSFKSVEKNLEGAFKKIGQGNVLGGIGDILTAPLKLAANAASGILSGVGLGVGQEISKNLGQGISEGIEKELAPLIGSSKLMGREMSAALSREFINALGRDLELPKRILKDLLGEEAIVNESAANRFRQSQQRKTTRKQASQQVGRELEFAQQNIGEIRDRGAAAQATRQELQQKSVRLQSRINETADSLGAKQLKERQQQIGNERNQLIQKLGSGSLNSTEVSLVQSQLERLADSYKEIDRAIEEINKTAAKKFQSLSDELQRRLDELYLEEQKSGRLAAPFSEIDLVDVPDSIKTKQGKTATNKPRINGFYQQTFNEVAMRSGVDPSAIDSARIPRLAVNPRLPQGANASYAADRNQIEVSSAMLEAINAGTVNQKQLETLIHELRHAFQSDLGQNLSEQSSVDLMRPNAQEARQFGRKIESSVAGAKGYSPEYARQIESDAYTFASRNSGDIYGKLGRNQAIAQLESSIGVGGGKASLKLEKAQKLAFSRIIELSKASSVDVSEEMQSAIAASEQSINRVNAALSKLDNLELLPVEEIQALQQSIESELDQSVTAILQQAGQFEAAIAGKPAQVRSQISQSLGQFNRKKDLAPLAQEFGIENADQLNKKQLIEQLTSNANLKALQPRVNEMTRARAQKQLARQEKLGAIAEGSGRVARGAVDVGQKVGNAVFSAATSDTAQQIVSAGVNTVRGLGAAAKASYMLAQGLESVALDMIPMGRTAKGLLKQTAVPALAFGAATQFLPGGGMVAEGMQHLAQGAISPLLHMGGDAMSAQATGFISQALPKALGIQSHVTGAVTGLINGAVESAIAPMVQATTAIVGGKVLTGAAGNALKPVASQVASAALPPAKSPALPAATMAALPAAQGTTELVENPFEGLTRPQLLAASRKLGIKGVNSKTNKDDLLNRLQSYSNQGEVDQVLGKVRSEIGTGGKPIAGFNKKAESEALKRLAATEKALNKKIADLAKATGTKREKLINEILSGTQNAISEIEQLKGQNFSGDTIRSLAGTQGRLENNYRNNPTLNDARNERINTARSAAIQSSNQRNITGLARVGDGGLIGRFKSLFAGNQQKADRLSVNYEAIYGQIAKLSSVAFDPKNLPKLSVDPKRLQQLGADAFYDIEKNTIVIDQTLARILSSRVDELHRNTEKLKGLIHEGRHSVQLDQGKLSLEQAAMGQGTRLMDGRNLSRSQREQVEQSVDVARKSGASQSQIDAARLLETDAYAFEGRTGEVLSGLARTPRRGLFSRIRDRFRPKARASNAGRIPTLEGEIATSRVGSAEDLSKLTDPNAVQAVANAANSSDRFDAQAARIQAQQDRVFSKVADPLKGGGDAVSRFKQQAAQQAQEYSAAFIGGLKGLSGAVPVAQRALGGLFSGGLKEGLSSLNEGFKKLIGNAGLLIKGFVGFAVLSTVLPAIQNFASESIKAAIALERVKTSLNFSTGNSGKALGFVSKEADRLGLSLEAAQQGYSQLAGSTRGTAVQGKATDELFSGVSAASTVLGLTGDQQGRIYNALSQTASKGKLSAEELRGQIGDAGLVGSFGIAARSLNISEAELNKRLEMGAVTAEDFLPKFGRQLQIEFGGSAESAAGGTQASLNKLQSSSLKAQQAIGGLFTPAVSAGASALAKIVDVLANNTDKVAIAALALTVRLTGVGAVNLVPLVQQFLGLGTAISGASVKAAAFQGLKLAGTFALIAGAMESVRAIGEIFALDEVGQGFQELGDRGEASMKRIAEAARKAAGIVDKASKPEKSQSKGFDFSFGLAKSTGLEDAGFSFKSDDLIKAARKNPLVTGLTAGIDLSRFSTVEELQQNRRKEQASRQGLITTDLYNQIQSGKIALRDAKGNAIRDAQGNDSINISDSLKQASEIDKQISSKQNERNRLAAQPKADKQAIAAADAEIKRLNEERSRVTNPITEVQAGIQAQISDKRKQLEKKGITGDEKKNLEQEIADLEKAQAQLNKLQSSFGTAADRVRDLSIALAEMGMELEAVQRNAEIKFNIDSRDNLRSRIKDFTTDENASLNAGVSNAQIQQQRSEAQLSGTRRVLDGIRPKLETPEARQVIESVVNPTTGKALSIDSSIEEIERARTGLGDSDPRKKQLDDLIAYKKALAELPNQERQVEADRLTTLEANQQKRLGLIEKEAQKRELSNRKSLNTEQISLINKQKNKSISEEDAAIESAKISGKQTDRDLSSAQTQLQELNAAFNEGTISAEQFAQKRIELEGKVSDLTRQKAQEELNLREAVNRKILEGFERRNKLASARIDAGASDAIADIRTTQLNGGIVGEGGQTEIAKVEQDATRQRIALKQQELSEVKNLRDQRVLSEKEAADRTLAIEQELRDQRSRLIDLQVQERLNAIQSESDARKRSIDSQIRDIEKLKAADDLANASLERRKVLLETQGKLSQATSDLRQSSLKIGIDRASEAGDLQKSLRDGSLGSNSAKVAQAQISELGFSGGNELQTLQAKQVLEAEADAEKLAALQQQQQLERESLKLQFELEKIAARRALNEAKIAENKALQNAIDAQSELQKAKVSGDQNQIANAQNGLSAANQGIELAKQGVSIAQENNAALEDRLKLEQQINDTKQQQAQNELNAQNQANRRSRQRDLAALQDQLGNGVTINGGALSSGTASGGSGGFGSGKGFGLFGEDIGAYDRGSGLIKNAISDNAYRGQAGQREAVLSALQMSSGKEREFAMAFASQSGYSDIVNALSKIDNQSSASPSVSRNIDSALMSAQFSGDVVSAITSLGDRIDNLANRPSNVSISTPNPVDDYADFLNKRSSSTLRGL